MAYVCNIPLKVDQQISEKLKDRGIILPAQRVADIRNRIKEDKNIDIKNDSDESLNLIKEARKEQLFDVEKSVKSKGTALIAHLMLLHMDTSAAERKDMINTLAAEFSLEVDYIIETIKHANPSLNPSRESILLGDVVNGNKIYGEGAIWDAVLNTLYDEYSRVLEDYKGVKEEIDLWGEGFATQGTLEKAAKLESQIKEYEKIFSNWSNLVFLARKAVKVRENIVSNNDFTGVAEASIDNFDSSNIEDYDPEMNTRESWQQANEERDPFASVGTKVRRILSSLKQYKPKIGPDGNLEYTPVLTNLDSPKYLDTRYVHKALMEIMRGVKDSDQMVDRLENIKDSQPWVYDILEEIRRDDYFKTQLFVDIKRNFQYYSEQDEDGEVNIKNEERSKMYLGKFLSALYLRPASLVKSTSGNTYKVPDIKDKKTGELKQEGYDVNYGMSLFDRNGKIIEENVKKFKEQITVLFGDKDTVNYSKFNSFKKEKRVEIMRGILESMGLDVDIETLEYIIPRRQIGTLIGYVKGLANYGLKSGFTKMTSLFEEDKSKTKEYYQKIIGLLNKYNTKVKKTIKVRYKNAKGKTADKYSDVTPSFAETMIETLQDIANRYTGIEGAEEADALVRQELKEYLENTYMRDRAFAYIDKETGELKAFNPWIQELWEMATNPKKTIDIKHMIVELLGADDVVAENLSEKQHGIAQLNYYFSKYSGEGLAYYPMFILGDSNKLKFIRAKKYEKNREGSVEDQVIHQFYLMYQREFERAKNYYTLNKIVTAQGYDALSWAERNEGFSLLKILGDEPIIDKNGKPVNFINSEEEFKRRIQPLLKAQSDASKKHFEDLGVFEREVKNGKSILKNFKKSKLTAENLETEWYNYFLNHKLALTCQLNMLDIDTALFPSSEEAQKRNKQNAAPGTILDLKTKEVFKDGEEAVEKAVYAKDIKVNAEETNPEFMRVMKAIFGEHSTEYQKYKENTLTDGQSWRTLKSYRNVMKMAGKWNEKLEEAYQIIQSLPKTGKLSDEDLKKLKKAKAIFQPIKPFTYTFEKIKLADGNEITIPVQIKCAETILIPQLLPEGTLKSMALYMEEKGIDIVVSDTAVKVGAHSSIEFPKFDKEKSWEENNQILRDAFDKQLYSAGQEKLGVHKLDYKDYRIQTNVPAHTDVSRTLGTQIRKLIMSDLKFRDEKGRSLHHTYDKYFEKIGKPKLFNSDTEETIGDVNAQRLIQIYNSLITCNFLSAFEDFANTIKDKKRLSKLLQESAISLDKVSTDNIIAYALTGNEEFLIPLFESSMEHDTVSEILSIFRKRVNKQQIRGGSAVQVSALGIEGFEVDGGLKVVTKGDNCLYAECEIPFDFHYINEYGQEVELQYEDYCDADGHFLKDESGNTLIEKHFPGILDIISYRVPTERNYSTINLKVVRVSKKSEGGTIKVPPQYTTIAGFDFDIDKLYLLRKEFRAVYRRKTPKAELNAIWSEIYQDIVYTGTPNALAKLQAIQDTEYKKAVKARKAEASDKGRKDFNSEHPLYSYWSKAKLLGSHQDAFNDYLVTHPEKQTLLDGYSQGIEGLVWDEYNPKLLPTEQSSTARNNMLLHIMQQRLMDPETLRSRYSPGGFDESKVAARTIRELLYSTDVKSLSDAKANIARKGKNDDTKQPYDPTDPQTMLVYNQMNQIAGKLIGVFANQNINHALASLAQKVELRTPIAFGSKWNTAGYYDLLHNPDGKDTFKTVAEFLAASVDAVKDPVLNFLNFNSLTANSACLLARLGYTPEEIGILFNQPIIKEACEKAQNDGIPLSIAIGSIKADYLKRGYSVDEAFKESSGNPELSTETLAKNIIDNRKGTLMQDKEAAKTQFKILNYFESIVAAADELNDFVQATRFTASASVGSTMGAIYEQRQKVESYLQKAKRRDGKGNKTSFVDISLSAQYDSKGNVISGFESPITSGKKMKKYSATENGKTVERIDIQDYIEYYAENPFAYEQCMYDCIQSLPEILEQYYPYETNRFKKMREAARRLVVTKKGVLKEATINTLHRDYIHYMLSTLTGGYFDGGAKMSKENMLYKHTKAYSQREYYSYQFALDYFNFAQDNNFDTKYPALSEILLPEIATTRTKIQSSSDRSGKISEQKMLTLKPVSGRGFEVMGQDFKDLVREEIEDMAKKYPAAAFGLFFYTYYKTGLAFGGNSLISLFPASVLYYIPVGKKALSTESVTLRYVDFLGELLHKDAPDVFPNNFLQQAILNHLDDNSFAQKLNQEGVEELKSLLSLNDRTISSVSSFELSAIDIVNLRKNKKLKVLSPIIASEQIGKKPDGSPVIRYSFAPVISFFENGKQIYYMANLVGGSTIDSSDYTFNQTTDRITYTKVEPLGETGISTSYGSSVDNAIREVRVVESQEETLDIKASEGLNDGEVDYYVGSYEQLYQEIILGTAEEEKWIALFEEYRAKSPIIRDANGEKLC